MQARLSLHLSKCHIVGNHMSRLFYICNVATFLVHICLLSQLAYNPSDDPIVTKMLEHFDFYMLPVVNPDGYEYTNTVSIQTKG